MKHELFVKAFTPDDDISANYIVAQGASNLSVKQGTAETDVLLGVQGNIDVDASAGDKAQVVLLGIAEVKIGGTVTRGDRITSDSAGKGVKLTDTMLQSAGCHAVGVALESGVSGDIISVFVDPQRVSKYDTATASAAEINLLDGSSYANDTASIVPVLDSSKMLRTTANVGTAATGSTAVEYGDGKRHTTVLTVSTTLPAIAGGADLGVGKLLYTLPAGECIVESAYMSLGITQSEGNINADTPDGGLGTTIASGAVATLDGTAAFENILTGQTFNNCTGTAEVKTAIPTAGVPLVVTTAGDHTIYFNVADGWAASGDAAAALAGTVVINWIKMS